MVQRCKELPRVVGAVEICRRVDGRISGAWDSILRSMVGAMNFRNVCLGVQSWCKVDVGLRLDCVIRGVKVEGLLRQATVIELRPNRRQHHPQQQPFDPVRRSGQSQRLQVSHAATQATSSNHMWPQEGDLAIAHRHADRGRLRLCIDRMVALIVRHMIFSSRQTYGCMHPCL